MLMHAIPWRSSAAHSKDNSLMIKKEIRFRVSFYFVFSLPDT